ncbi:MAG: 3-phosphoshikimate 1-carboxyvinyltransferase [Candidatus Omnitrophica bacterium]|nr:3-phosphoshikimate 1-carboxyvinyltransferase [Candidatus Omnitrophota bacterium]
MRPKVFRQISGLRGKVILPGDKSIAHRAIILSSISRGKVQIDNFPANVDCLVTLAAFKKLGVKSVLKKNNLIIFGRGLNGLKKPKGPIFLSESGTSFRLLLGVLAGQNFSTMLTAGPSLSVRPMRRVTEPLRKMGAQISSYLVDTIAHSEEYPPVEICGHAINGIDYKIPLASAQIKSAVLLAGLFAKGKTTVTELVRTRDHTERMLRSFKVKVGVRGKKISVRGGQILKSPGKIFIPGDISSAAFFMVAAAIVPDSEILIENVSLNPLRIGVLKALKRMGVDIKLTIHIAQGEPVGDITVKSSKLTGIKIESREIPSLIDELPILMVAASFASGKSVFEGVGELRVKETDRIRSMTENLLSMGASIEVSKENGEENIVINGVKVLRAAKVKSFGDHRTAMSMLIAGLVASGPVKVDDLACIRKSFPDFVKVLSKLKHG